MKKIILISEYYTLTQIAMLLNCSYVYLFKLCKAKPDLYPTVKIKVISVHAKDAALLISNFRPNQKVELLKDNPNTENEYF